MILGHYEVSTDDKCRIFVPANVGSEKNDILALMFDEELGCHKLYHANTIKSYFDSLDNLMSNAKSDEELKKYMLWSYKLSKSILKECVVDGQRRIFLGNIFTPNEQLLLMGANNHLILERKKNK